MGMGYADRWIVLGLLTDSTSMGEIGQSSDHLGFTFGEEIDSHSRYNIDFRWKTGWAPAAIDL